MLKGGEIGLTLRSSWIMNAVSINVCIINHISTNRTSVEPVVLSDMETGLDYCLDSGIKDSSMICRFLHGCDSQVERPTAAGPKLFFFSPNWTVGDCFGLNGQIFVQFHTGREEKWRGNGSRKCCCILRICFIVFQKDVVLCAETILNTWHMWSGTLVTFFFLFFSFFSSS